MKRKLVAGVLAAAVGSAIAASGSISFGENEPAATSVSSSNVSLPRGRKAEGLAHGSNVIDTFPMYGAVRGQTLVSSAQNSKYVPASVISNGFNVGDLSEEKGPIQTLRAVGASLMVDLNGAGFTAESPDAGLAGASDGGFSLGAAGLAVASSSAAVPTFNGGVPSVTSPVPEPKTYMMVGAAIVVLLVMRRRFQRANLHCEMQ